MSHVDFFSRNHIELQPKNKNINKTIQKEGQLVKITQDWLIAEQSRDFDTSEIISKLNNVENIPNTILQTYELCKGVVLCCKIRRNGQTKKLAIIPKTFI